MRKVLFLMLVFASLTSIALAQSAKGNRNSEDDDDPFEKKSYFMYGLNYLSNNVYLGRKDTMVIPYYSPYIGYHFGNGFYGKALVSYTTTEGTHVDLTTLELGYDHSFGEHFTAGVNAEKFFYNKNSISVRANTKGCAGLFGQYSNDWFETQATFDLNFNKRSTDYVAGWMLDHDFSTENKLWHFIPTVLINLGTQHYYDEYFINKLTKKDKTLKLKKVVQSADDFVPLDWEFSTKVTFRTGKWLFTAQPTYVIPMSPSVVELPKRTIQEKISNSFFVEVDICHR